MIGTRAVVAEGDVERVALVDSVGGAQQDGAERDPHRARGVSAILLGLADEAGVVADADRGFLVERKAHAEVETPDVAGLDIADELGRGLR